MEIVEFSTLESLAPWADDWDRLADGVPMRGWTWASRWWQHYGSAPGESQRLAVTAVFGAGGRPVGLAPWYVARDRSGARVIRWLGSGEVCSDYLSILCQPSQADTVAETLAGHLLGQPKRGHSLCGGWDRLEIEGVDAADKPVNRLVEYLTEGGCLVHASQGMRCWRVELPATWDEYLARLSKCHRKQLRRLDRDVLGSGRAILHTVQTVGQLGRALNILEDLHQRRRRSLGQRGCFASARFTAFHRDVMPRLLGQGQLQLHWLELDGRPVAADYHLYGDGIVYVYQGGVEPEALDEEPGRLMTLATLRRAIEQGYWAVDFLRGDEPYKAHFRARPRANLTLRVVPRRPIARLRHGLWLAGRNLKQWITQG